MLSFNCTIVQELGSVAGPVIQANGRLTFEDDFRSGGLYTSLNSEPATSLGLPILWSLWGNQAMARCQEMSTLPAGHILQCKETSASTSESLGLIVSELL